MSQGISFKTYSEDKIEAQIQLINSIAKSWTAFGYPDATALKTAYQSNPDFTPETRHYVYSGDKLVGFLSSAVESEKDGKQYGSIQYPFLLDEYRSYETELMNRAIDQLKSRGVEVITTNLCHLWGDSSRIINEYNFQKQKAWDRFALFDDTIIDSLRSEHDHSEVTEFVPSEHGELLYEAYFVPNDLPRERFDRFIGNVTASQSLASFPVVLRNGKLVAFTRVEYEPDILSLFAFHVNCFDSDEGQRQKDMQSILSYICSKASDYDNTRLFLYIGPDEEKARMYEQLGINFEVINTYEMHL
ncbi:MAG: hypothetical protein ACXAE3_17425 [Candidatus Kariarchaeaceae archaeon]|jgi:hypothetical protein